MTIGVGQLAAEAAEAGAAATKAAGESVGEAWHALQEHLWFRRRHWRVLQCTLCGESFKTHRELDLHYRWAPCIINRPRVSFECTESQDIPRYRFFGLHNFTSLSIGPSARARYPATARRPCGKL